MAEAEERRRWRNRTSPALAFVIWFTGWLFTIGYAGLVWWEIILAIVVWPYFLGRTLV
jgi:hypothetical protein